MLLDQLARWRMNERNRCQLEIIEKLVTGISHKNCVSVDFGKKIPWIIWKKDLGIRQSTNTRLWEN